MKKVSVIKCKDYNYTELKEALNITFKNLGGIEKYITKGTKVALKPNLLMPCNPNTAATTNPYLIHALTDILIEHGAIVSIVESPGGPYIKTNLKNVYKACGMEAIAEKTELKLNFDLSVKLHNIADGKLLKKVEIIEPLLNADIIINLPKLKTHGQMTYTGAVKNMFGSVPGAKKAEYHFRMSQYDFFANALIDIFLATKPGLSIMDAVVGMDGNGPSAGTPKRLGFIAASKDAFALDLTCLKIVNVPPEQVPIIEQAIKRGLCPSDIREINICGTPLDEIKIDDFSIPEPDKLNSINFTDSKFFNLMANCILKPKPVINKKLCTGCKICADNCPAKIMVTNNKIPRIELSKCIRCFCCQELCPQHAIKIKRLPRTLQSILNTLFLIFPMLISKFRKLSFKHSSK